MERTVVAVDVDHTLAKVIECAVAWQNEEKGASLSMDDVKSANWASILGGTSAKETEEKLLEFYHSTHFSTKVEAVPGVTEVLKPLRKYFSFLALTDRPRVVEKQTREWLDAKYPGVFDKLVFVDEDENEDIVARKKELYEEFKVKVVISADAELLSKLVDEGMRVIVVGSVPWENTESKSDAATATELVRVKYWSKVKETLEKIIQELQLKPADKVFAGPKLSRYTDDLVTVSMRKPAVFYANIINSKFTVQKQETIRLQASEAAITTAVQTAEMLRLQNNAITTKISTRYTLNRAKDRGGHRVPKLELVLQRVDRTE